MFEFDPHAMDFDGLCNCGNPECPVGRTAQAAKEVLLDGRITPQNAELLAFGFVSMTRAAHQLLAQKNLLMAMMELSFGDEPIENDGGDVEVPEAFRKLLG